MRARELAACVLLSVLAASGALVGVPAAAGAATDADLPARLEAALRHTGLRGARVAALVVRADDGAILFERESDRALVPASNQKILTALSALETFGPSHRFTTQVLADRLPDAEGAVGWLAVVGGGDPMLTSEHWWRLAADLRRAGLRRVDGALWLDDAAFDAQRWSGDWGAISTRAYHAPVSALMANFGAFALEVLPGGAAGEPARVAVDPPVDMLRIVDRVRTRAPATPPKLAADRGIGEAGVEIWTVSGVVPARGERQGVWRSVADPTSYAGSVLRLQLGAVGIAVAGPTQTGRAPESAVELLAYEGEPLGRIVNGFMKFSNNPVAEMLLKSLGRAATGEPGSWDNGRRALRASLERLQLPLPGLVTRDGSGLARGNRVAPRTLVGALLRARDSLRFGPELVASLPIAGRDGTLRKRMERSPDRIRAKTGLLEGVTALSGYADSPGGVLVFSILANGYQRGDEAAMQAMDGFAAALVANAARP